MEPRIEIPRPELEAFCRRNHIRRLSLFGSVLREDFRDDSDVDVLVEFEAGQVPGLKFFRLERELSKLLGRKVELHTPAFLSRHFRDRALAETRVQYDVEAKLEAVREAAKHQFPTADIEQMLAEIGMGYGDSAGTTSPPEQGEEGP